jgi:hypothetical protein
MRVLILACSQQKANTVSKLITDPTISKITLSNSSKKLVTQAHAVVIYFETEKDVKKMENLMHIYDGIPIKMYFGNKNYNNWTNFFDYGKPSDLVKALQENKDQVIKSSQAIFDTIREGKKRYTAGKLLSGLDPNTRDMIEESTSLYFSDGRSTKKSVPVTKEKFTEWWQEGRIDQYEQIKYYLIEWMAKQVSTNVDKFKSY